MSTCIIINAYKVTLCLAFYLVCDTLSWISKGFIAMLLQVKPSTIEMKEGGVRLRLTVVDTPGFGDAVDNTDW